MQTFKTTIRTLDTPAFEHEVESLVIPGVDGSFGVLGGHAPLIGAVAAGILKIRKGRDITYLVIGNGLIDINAERVLILTETAITCTSDVDAEEKLESYQKAIFQGSLREKLS